MSTHTTESTVRGPQPQSPAETHVFATINDLAMVLGVGANRPDEQKHYIRAALRELWRALGALDPAPVAGTD